MRQGQRVLSHMSISSLAFGQPLSFNRSFASAYEPGAKSFGCSRHQQGNSHG